MEPVLCIRARMLACTTFAAAVNVVGGEPRVGRRSRPKMLPVFRTCYRTVVLRVLGRQFLQRTGLADDFRDDRQAAFAKRAASDDVGVHHVVLTSEWPGNSCTVNEYADSPAS